MQKLMGDEGWGGGGGACFSLLTPSVCGTALFKLPTPEVSNKIS